MFTGLVEEIGEVVSLDDLGDSTRITIRAAAVLEDAKHGDSISVNGCCLTVMAQTADTFSADVMAESLARTNLGEAQAGDPGVVTAGTPLRDRAAPRYSAPRWSRA